MSEPTSPPRLRVRDLSVAYGSTVAVDDVSLAVDAGEVVSVLGPSGCGKSSLLRGIAGLEPARGTVAIDGTDVTRARPDRRGVGFLFQGHALFPHADVAGNVGFGLRMQDWPRDAIDERVAEVLALVGLPDTQRRPVDTLSGGEQQRVALARAVAPDPGVLLLDEPLSSIDRALRDRLLEDLPAVFERLGAAVVHVTHDQEEALALADRVAVMRAGRLVQVGPPMEVWRRPRDGFVARFLGQRNLLPVDVRAGTADTALGPVAATEHPDGPALLLIPPSAVWRVHGGPPPGPRVPRRVLVVRSRRFSGDHLVLTCTDDDGMRLDVVDTSTTPPPTGTTIDVAVDLARVHVVPIDAGQR